MAEVEPYELEVPKKIQNIKNGVPMVMKFIPVETIATEEYARDPEARSSKALLLFYLNSKHEQENKKQDKQKVLTSSINKKGEQTKQTYGAKRYNRIVFFADLLHSGKVCCKILETHPETIAFFANMSLGGFGVGSCYVIEEPFPSTEHLGNTDSILQLSDYTRAYPVTCNLTQKIPRTPLKFPAAGKTLYFAVQNYKKLRLSNSVIYDSSCGGTFCDRQIFVDPQVPGHLPCGCQYRDKVSKQIVKHDITIPCEESIDDTGITTVRGFRSYRFDHLIFHGGSERVFSDTKIELENYTAHLALRSRFKKLVELVNKGHGWTIVGWTRTGKIRDVNEEGNRDAIDIAAEDLKPHITYLMPSDMSDVDAKKNPEYKKLIITETPFIKEVRDQERADAALRSQKKRPRPVENANV